jgi:hypothetical protein
MRKVEAKREKMIICDHPDEARQYSERSDRPARLCDICHENLATEPFVYEFFIQELGSMYGDICMSCVSKYEDDDDLAMALLDEEMNVNELRLAVINAMLAEFS